jgi:hypothetical protein
LVDALDQWNSGLACPGQLWGDAAVKGTRTRSGKNYGEGEEVGAVVDSVVGDSVAEVVVLVSDEAVSLGLAAGVTVSVFCSQAASRPALARMQMYFFIVVVEEPVFA